MLRQFIDYIKRNEELINERDYLYDQWRMFEHAFIQAGPALAAEYALDDRTAINLYDCLIPKLHEHRKFKIRPEFYYTEKKQVENWGWGAASEKVKMMSLEMELTMEGMQKEMDRLCDQLADFKLVTQPQLEAEKKELEKKVENLENELGIVTYLEKVVE